MLGTTNVNIGTDGLQRGGPVRRPADQLRRDGQGVDGLEHRRHERALRQPPAQRRFQLPEFRAIRRTIGRTWIAAGGGWANHENNVGITYDGSYYMVVGGFEDQGGGCHQTVPATAGATYELSVLSGADAWWLPYGEMRLFFLDAGGAQVGYRCPAHVESA